MGKLEIQKTTLNGQAAVEVRTPEKVKRASAKERPLSMPPSFFDGSDGEASVENAQRRDVAAKPKKRQAPPPPAASQTSLINDGGALAQKEAALSSMNMTRSQHTRRGSDSSSGYHGSSQPSPNPPAIADASGAMSSSRNASGSEKSSYSYRSRTSAETTTMQHATISKEENADLSGQKKKQKAPLPPSTLAGHDEKSGMGSLVCCLGVVYSVPLSSDTARPISTSPAESRSSAIKEGTTLFVQQHRPRSRLTFFPDAGATTDSRCSSPTTADDVDKDFQEVIQQIQKQISAEEPTVAATSTQEDAGEY